jgi:predicted NBD/HSP70 family sugar kinase
MVLHSTEQRILDFVRYSADSDRTELAAELGLPRPTVISAVRKLIGSGALLDVDAAEGRSTAGRGRHVIRFPGPSAIVGLIRWTDHSLRVGLHDLDGTALHEEELDIPDPADGPAGLVPAAGSLLRAAGSLSDHGPAGRRLVSITISAPAPFRRGRGAPRDDASTLGLPLRFAVTEHVDFDDYLSRRFPVDFITENDINLAGLGEYFATRDRAQNMVYLRVNDEGIGSAIVAGGVLMRGAQGFAGELAHLQIDRDGPLCPCGGRGCLSNQLRGMMAAATSQAYGRPVGYAELSRHARDGDAGASRLLADVGRAIGQPFGQICTVLDPEVIVIDATDEAVVAGIRESFAIFAPPAIAHNVRFRTSALGADAEVRGALEIPREAARRG